MHNVYNKFMILLIHKSTNMSNNIGIFWDLQTFSIVFPYIFTIRKHIQVNSIIEDRYRLSIFDLPKHPSPCQSRTSSIMIRKYFTKGAQNVFHYGSHSFPRS